MPTTAVLRRGFASTGRSSSLTSVKALDWTISLVDNHASLRTKSATGRALEGVTFSAEGLKYAPEHFDAGAENDAASVERKAGPTLVLSGITEVSTLQQQSVVDGPSAATDGGEQTTEEDDVEGSRAIVNNHLAKHYETNDTVTAARIAGELEGMSPSDVQGALDRLATQGRVQKEAGETYRLT